MTREEAIGKGFLLKKKVYLKPVARQGKMVNDPAHTAFFMYDGAFIGFVLPSERNRPVLANPFSSTEEKEYFERELDVDLNPYKKQDNFWKTFKVKFQKSPATMHNGVELDLADPIDNLRWKVLKLCPEVAPSWEERERRPGYRFALVDEDYEGEKAGSELDLIEEMFTFYGTIKKSPVKMRDFLEIYFMTAKKLKEVPDDADALFMQKELKVVMETDKLGFLEVSRDENYAMKLMISKAIRRGAIEKKGVNRYDIVGDTTNWSLIELVNYLKNLKETTDDVYLKLEAQTKMPVK